ncbi:hypothetical protein ACOB87_15950 [Streptomyces sp. YS-B37]
MGWRGLAAAACALAASPVAGEPAHQRREMPVAMPVTTTPLTATAPR